MPFKKGHPNYYKGRDPDAPPPEKKERKKQSIADVLKETLNAKDLAKGILDKANSGDSEAINTVLSVIGEKNTATRAIPLVYEINITDNAKPQTVAAVSADPEKPAYNPNKRSPQWHNPTNKPDSREPGIGEEEAGDEENPA